MLTIGEKIKILLAEKKITASELARLAELDINVISNLIYNRTRRVGYLVKISRALGVPLEHFTGIIENIPFSNVNIEIATKVMSVVHDVTKKYNLQQIPYFVFLDIFHSIYQEMLENPQDLTHINSFAHGMIKSKIDEKLIS